MTDIGSQLRAAREAQGLTLEQAFKGTRIKLPYLDAIEANQFHMLPGPVQARGFVRSYANFLGLDGEHMASALDAEKEPGPEVRTVGPAAAAVKPLNSAPPNKPLVSMPPPKPAISTTPKSFTTPVEKPLATPSARPSLKLPAFAASSSKVAKPASAGASGMGVPTWALIAGAVVLFILGALLIVTALKSAGQSPASGVPLPATGQAPLVNRGDTLPPQAPVSLTLASGEHVWTRITVDGQTAFEGMLPPDSVRVWEAAKEIIVETGNAAALTVIFEGQTKVLGERGQIVARAWGRNGTTNVPLAGTHAVAPPATALATTVGNK